METSTIRFMVINQLIHDILLELSKHGIFFSTVDIGNFISVNSELIENVVSELSLNLSSIDYENIREILFRHFTEQLEGLDTSDWQEDAIEM